MLSLFRLPSGGNSAEPLGGFGEMVEMEDRWLSVDEISKHLGVSNDTVYRWIGRNMPSHRMGRLWKFKKNEVDAWVKTGGAVFTKVKTSKGRNSKR